MCSLLNVSVNNDDQIFRQKKILGILLICRNAEGVHAYLVKCWRGTYPSAGMLKGYMAWKRLGTPGLEV